MSNPEPETSREPRPRWLGWRSFQVVAIGLGTAAGLFLVWNTSGSLFLIFTGLLFAVILDAATQGLGRVLPIARRWRLAVVCLSLLILAVLGVSLGGYTIAQQADELFATVQRQLSTLRQEVEVMKGTGIAKPDSNQGEQGKPAPPSESGKTPDKPGESGFSTVVRSFFPNASVLLQSATTALGGVAGVLGNLAVIIFLGLYVAADPPTYRNGTLLLFPPQQRERVGRVLDESAATLRSWVIGQLVSMAIITAMTYVALMLVGMPAALVLALITGLFGFIPYIGSFVAGAIIVLFGLAQSASLALWGLGVYLLVQFVESYVLAPMVQRWSINISPALIIGGLTIFGGLFGIWGFILAAPLLAVLRVLILRLWVEEVLGDTEGAKMALQKS